MKSIVHLPAAVGQNQSYEVYRVQQKRLPNGRVRILSMQGVDGKTISSQQRLLRRLPEHISEDDAASKSVFEEWLLRPSELSRAHKAFLEKKSFAARGWAGSEVRTLVSQGPVANRINLTIVGDGYTEAEKNRFFEDAQRLTQEMFVGQAFASYLPLFNVHAVFVPSKDSGITDVSKKDTALGLYRSPKGSKRAIMPGNEEAARRALALAPATDYPVLLANDEYYGGLGGEFAITTRSLNSGSMVLNHEFGHNISEVGEEYDGGQVYTGANFSGTSKVSWGEWLDGALVPQKGKSLAGSYAWKNISKEPLRIKFNMPGKAGENVLVVDLSSVGWENEKAIEVLIDGKAYALDGIYTNDRSFFRLRDTAGIAPGQHELVIRDKSGDGDNVVAFARITAYPADYDFTPGHIGAFPLFDSAGQFVGYRPTHESCLMRDMRQKEFCPIDRQSIWHNLLRRVDLIDAVESSSSGNVTRASVSTPDLLGLSIRWFVLQDGKENELTEFRDLKSWSKEGLKGAQILVRVNFATPEVRQYNKDFENEARLPLS